jgi:hypothetical protein
MEREVHVNGMRAEGRRGEAERGRKDMGEINKMRKKTTIEVRSARKIHFDQESRRG